MLRLSTGECAPRDSVVVLWHPRDNELVRPPVLVDRRGHEAVARRAALRAGMHQRERHHPSADPGRHLRHSSRSGGLRCTIRLQLVRLRTPVPGRWSVLPIGRVSGRKLWLWIGIGIRRSERRVRVPERRSLFRADRRHRAANRDGPDDRVHDSDVWHRRTVRANSRRRHVPAERTSERPLRLRQRYPVDGARARRASAAISRPPPGRRAALLKHPEPRRHRLRHP